MSHIGVKSSSRMLFKNGDGGCCGDGEKCSIVGSMSIIFLFGPICLFTGLGCAISGDLMSKAVKNSNAALDFQKLPLGCQLEDVAWQEATKGSGKESYCVDSYTCVLHHKKNIHSLV
jgi:hypothetical protein